MWWIVLGFTLFLSMVWAIANRMFPHTITWKEGLMAFSVQGTIMAILISATLWSQGSDVQIINGQVTSKYSEKVSCSHSYSCRCRNVCSGSGDKRSCTRVCDTCYEHRYDVDWVVKSDVGYVEIDRVNRQGTQEPPRWTSVVIGEPFARMDSYYNYIKASPFSIFNKSKMNDETVVPGYLTVHDYYKVDRVINFQSPWTQTKELNQLLNESLRKIGPSKKVNVVVYLHSKGDFFSEAIRTKHLGGKINDVYVVIDIDAQGKFNNVAVFSWSKSDMVNVVVRDELLDLGTFNAQEINRVISEGIQKHYVRRDIEEFKYLEDDYEIPNWLIATLMIFGLLFPFASAYVAHRVET